jgi:phosphoribosylformimino-5-aminoimidazole carboxamide ribotide isomerase
VEIVPVIDLLDGQVVRAQRGERDHYRPINSALCQSSNPLEVTHRLLGLYPFKILYIADLDAIQKRGNHLSTITSIRKTYPNIDIWLDGGFSNLADCHPWQNLNITFVIGSESMSSIEQLHQMRSTLGDAQLVLSLDWHNEVPQGSSTLFENTEKWPQRVIIMPLARVGSYAGPDMIKLKMMLSLSGARSIYAAGGIRDIHDLHALKALGVSGSLLASALHDQAIDKNDLMSLSN